MGYVLDGVNGWLTRSHNAEREGGVASRWKARAWATGGGKNRDRNPALVFAPLDYSSHLFLIFLFL